MAFALSARNNGVEEKQVTSSVSPNVRALRRPAGGAPSAGRRFRANWPGEVRGAGVRVTCTVIDISSVGACLRLEQAAPTTGTLHLIIGNVVAPIQATPAWRKNALLGIRFLREQSWVLESCNKRFDPAAWIKD
jgi:PilZ domain-containing protein